jgi:hypothetical protein
MMDTNRNVVDENSPLVAPTKADDEVEVMTAGSNSTIGTDQVLKSTWYLFILTLGIGGWVVLFLNSSELANANPFFNGYSLQIVWSVELSHGSVSRREMAFGHCHIRGYF